MQQRLALGADARHQPSTVAHDDLPLLERARGIRMPPGCSSSWRSQAASERGRTAIGSATAANIPPGHPLRSNDWVVDPLGRTRAAILSGAPEWRNGRRGRLKPGGPERDVGVRLPPPAPPNAAWFIWGRRTGKMSRFPGITSPECSRGGNLRDRNHPKFPVGRRGMKPREVVARRRGASGGRRCSVAGAGQRPPRQLPSPRLGRPARLFAATSRPVMRDGWSPLARPR